MFVGVVYAAAIWLARRANAAIPVRIAIFFYALVFVFFYLPLTQDYVNLPVDLVKTLPPWAHLLRDHRASNLYLNDIVLQIVPWAQQVRDAWRSLHVPVWNELSAAGYQLLGQPKTTAVSPVLLRALAPGLGHA